VRSLSGLVSVVTESDALVPGREPTRRLAFSILVNEIPSGADQRAKEFHENVVEVLDEYLAERARVTGSASVR